MQASTNDDLTVRLPRIVADPYPDQPAQPTAAAGRDGRLMELGAAFGAGAVAIALAFVATNYQLSLEFRVLTCIVGLCAVVLAITVVAIARGEANRVMRKVESLHAVIEHNREQYKMRLDSLTGAVMELAAATRTSMARGTHVAAALDETGEQIVELTQAITTLAEKTDGDIELARRERAGCMSGLAQVEATLGELSATVDDVAKRQGADLADEFAAYLKRKDHQDD